MHSPEIMEQPREKNLQPASIMHIFMHSEHSNTQPFFTYLHLFFMVSEH